MFTELDIDAESLVEEIARYLGAIDAYRAAGCEPTWRRELPSDASAPLPAVASKTLPSDIRLH